MTRFTNLLKLCEEDQEVPDYSVNVGKYISTMRTLRRKYRRNEITLFDVYEYYRMSLSAYTSKKIRCIFITISLCLTIYLTLNPMFLKDGGFIFHASFSSVILMSGCIFSIKEAFMYVTNIRKMLSVFYIYKYVFKEDEHKIVFKNVVDGIIKLERKVHKRILTSKDIRNALNHERTCLLLMMEKFPSLFNPMCSKCLLYILRLYIRRIVGNSLEKLNEEIRIASVTLFVMSPVISVFLMIYYTVKIIERSQSNLFYVFGKAYKPAFVYLVGIESEYPHETQKKVQKSAKHLSSYFRVRKRDYITGICSAISFFLSCLVFLIVYLILNTVLTNKPSLNEIPYQDVKFFGWKIAISHLLYLIGGISCSLKLLNFECAATKRHGAFSKWCKFIEQRGLIRYPGNRRHLFDIILKVFVPRLRLFMIEIISPFVIPFQLNRLRNNLGDICTTLSMYGEECNPVRPIKDIAVVVLQDYM